MPNLLILGGVGPLGKIVALAALESCAYTRIRVVDKQLPETAYFLDHELDRFRHLEIIQLDLGVQDDDGSLLSKAFNLPGDERWDIVVYAYLDTLSLGSNEENIRYTTRRARQVALASQIYRVGVMIYLTQMAMVKWKPSMGKVKEDFKLQAWPKAKISRAVVSAEKAVREVESLPLVILRVGCVYGRGVMGSVDYALCISRVFCEDSSRTFYNIYTEKEMLNVVHTDDVVRAILHSASWYLSNGHQDVRVFNVADESNMTSAGIYRHTCALQKLQFENLPSVTRVLSRFALNIKCLCELMISQGSKVWVKLLDEHGISSTPLDYSGGYELSSTPWGISLDNTAFCQETGFVYQYPTLTQETVLQTLEYWRALKAWPDEKNGPGRNY